MQDIAEKAGWEKPPDYLAYGEFAPIMDALSGLVEMSLVYGRRGEKVEPAGLLGVAHFKEHSQPHVVWFPWATKRNRIEGTAAFLKSVEKPMLIFATDDPLWKRMAELKLASRVGAFDTNVVLWRSPCLEASEV